jgi:3-oxoacyl-[acyl-carrier-protein] synthase II
MAAERVLVTGIGAITPLGGDVKSTWAGLLVGQSGVRPLTESWAADLPVRIAARTAIEPSSVLDRVEARRFDRATQFMTVALREAWADAGYGGPAQEGSDLEPERLAVSIGTGIGGFNTLLANYDVLRARGPSQVSPIALPMLMPNNPAAQASIFLNARADIQAPNSACATGAEAVARALDMIRLNRADVVIAGGTEAVIHALPIAAFARMMALSRNNDMPERASRPYDKNRDGFVLGEGAALIILERESHARVRGARIYCALAGAGISSDAFHIVHPDDGGRGMAQAMRKMLADAELEPGDVAHVNAHATATLHGDIAESRAMSATLGTGGYAVSAIKSMTGHLIGAAGSLSAIASILALRDRIAPPTINIEDIDDAIELDIVRSEPRKLPQGDIASVVNAAGFGGHNVSLAFCTA